jgi:pimeloyl-ACP methyl ester carboxylesterase
VLAPLGQQGTVVAYDRPAFGLTARPLPGEWTGASPYRPEAQVRLLFGLMDALGIERPCWWATLPAERWR